MQVAICDDEKEIRELLSSKVLKQYPDAECLLYSAGDQLLLDGCKPDILLLDIQMDGKNGIETAKEFRREHENSIIIFVTAIEEHVFEAFDVGAFHYLVKPFTDEKFREVFQNAVIQHQRRKQYDLWAGGLEESAHILVQFKGQHRKVLLEDIIYAEVYNRKVILHKKGEDIEYYGKLSALQELTGENFFRSHRSYLVNLKYVEKYDATVIEMEQGQAMIAKQNYAGFVKAYLQYNRRGKG